MTEAMTSVPWELCEAVVRALTFPCDLMPLKDIVLQIIDRVGGKRESVYGLKVANQCFRYELLELIRSDGTKVQFSKTDCKPPTVCAAPVNPAEAIWVEPREDGRHFVRRPATPPAPPAEPPQSPATATPPADRQLPAAGGPEPSQSPQAPWQSQQPTHERESTSAGAQPQSQSTNLLIAEVLKLSGKNWVPKAYARRPNELLAMGITGASGVLAEESKNAADCTKPLKARYIEQRLRELEVFPKAHRGSPKQRPK